MKQIVPGWRLVCILPPTITPNPEIWLLVATSIAPGMAHPWKHGGSYPTLLPARSSREPQWWRNGKRDGTTTIENHKNPFFRRFAFTSAQFPEQNKSKRCDWVSFWPSPVLGRTATATGHPAIHMRAWRRRIQRPGQPGSRVTFPSGLFGPERQSSLPCETQSQTARAQQRPASHSSWLVKRC